jgi:hypothetical protein
MFYKEDISRGGALSSKLCNNGKITFWLSVKAVGRTGGLLSLFFYFNSIYLL